MILAFDLRNISLNPDALETVWILFNSGLLGPLTKGILINNINSLVKVVDAFNM